MILKELNKLPKTPIYTMVENINRDPKRIKKMLSDLEREGFIQRKNNIISIG